MDNDVALNKVIDLLAGYGDLIVYDCNMKNNWEQKEIIQAWIEANNPYGDYWRMALVNPIVLNYVRKLVKERNTDISQISFYESLAIQNKNLPSEEKQTDKYIRWHEKLKKESLSLKDIKIFDLGCGEAYLSRLLSPFGVSYLGVDGSSEFQKFASKNAEHQKNKGNITILCGNLDGYGFIKNTEKKLKKDLDKFGIPDLALGIIILEHLENPLPLLCWLSHTLASTSRVNYALFVTLNADYHSCDFNNKLNMKKDHGAEFSLEGEAKIQSANVPVDVIIRCRRKIERLFRDSNFRIIQYSPLFFSPAHYPHGFNNALKGIPPFDCYLVTPLPKPISLSKNELNDIFEILCEKSIIHAFSDSQKNKLKENLLRCDILEFSKNQIIIAQHNMGGDLYIVLEGAVELRHNKEVLAIFSCYELIGELEAEERGYEKYYIYPIFAGSEKVKVFRITHELFLDIVQSQYNTFEFNLFSNLRKRICGMNIANIKLSKISDKKEEVAVNNPREDLIDKYEEHIRLVSRTLLHGSEMEIQKFVRDPEGRILLLPADEINSIMSKEKKGDGITTVNNVLKYLTHLNIIDAVPFSDLNLSADGGKCMLEKSQTRAFEKIYSASCDYYFPHKRKNSHLDTVLNNIKDEIISKGHRKLKKGFSKLKDGKYWSKAALGYISDLEKIRNEENNGQSIEMFKMFLWKMIVLWTDLTPSLIFIRDIQALRKISLGDDKVVKNYFKWRSQYLIDGKAFDPKNYLLVLDQEPGRFLQYIDCVEDFIINDIKECGGTLQFSGTFKTFALPILAKKTPKA
jgi:CRP-like cAMP-binding protein/2-polyprenyl-3-methyl-5-hydroxy-6-metoxy-1,4-benzoquinol methylase